MGCVVVKPPAQPAAAPAAEGGTLLGASAEDSGAALKAVVICEEAVRSKEAADQERGAAELEGVKRKAQRKSTPFVRPGDAEAFDEEDSEGSQATATSDRDKHATISPEAVRALEEAEQSRDAEEETQARRSRQRKSTPFCGGGAGLVFPHDEDEDDDAEEADANADSLLTAVPLLHTDEDPILATTGGAAEGAAEAPWFWCAGCAHIDAAEQRF